MGGWEHSSHGADVGMRANLRLEPVICIKG